MWELVTAMCSAELFCVQAHDGNASTAVHLELRGLHTLPCRTRFAP